jgi:endonuclease/exonuclease/phosphatase (EEP) superfamily protein YafD
MRVFSLRSAVAGVATVVVGVVAAVEWFLLVARPETGLPGVLQVVAPHLAILGLAAAPFVGLHATRRRGVVMAALVAVVGLRFAGEWLSLPAAPPPTGATTITVETWNLEVSSRPPTDTLTVLRERRADIVALQELQPAMAEAIEADARLTTAYPYRRLDPLRNVLGLAILSRYPIVAAADVRYDPAVQQVELDAGGRRVTILNAHPLHGDIETFGDTRLPIGIQVDRRNAELETIRAIFDGAASRGSDTVLLGDLNTASSEPAFARLVAGLHDAHAEVGEGTGWTWRPSRAEFLGIGLFRIDHVISSAAVQPLSVEERCPAVGDHCLVRAELWLEPAAG